MSSDERSFTRRLLHGRPDHADEKANGREELPDISGLSCQSHRVIVETVLSMLQGVGYHQLTIEGVAAASGVDAAAIHWRWATKASLVIEAISHRLRQGPSMYGNPEKDIRAIVLNLIEIFNDTVPRALPALTGDGADDSRVAQKLASVLGRYRPSNAAALRDAVSYDGSLYDIDIIAVLDVIAGTILYRRLMHRPVDDVLVEQLTQLALAGQLPRLNPSTATCTTSNGRSAASN